MKTKIQSHPIDQFLEEWNLFYGKTMELVNNLQSLTGTFLEQTDLT